MTSNVYENYFTATILLNKIYSMIKKKMPSLINPNVKIHYKDKYIIIFCDYYMEIHQEYMDKSFGHVTITNGIKINLNLNINDEFCNSSKYHDLPSEYLNIVKELYNLIVINQIIQ